MNFYKTSLIAPALALLLCSNLNAEELYSVQNQSLKEAIELISKQSNTPYMVDGKLLKGKKAPNIKNIEGLENTLDKILKGTNLEAVIEEGTILIKKKKASNSQKSSKTSLGEITVTGTKLNKSLQETLESVQVFDDVDIVNSAKMDDLTDIFDQTSSVRRSGNFDILIRGIDDTGFGGSNIGPRTIDVNIDAVSQSRDATRDGAVSTWDLEQVEILKGPQSTTQGRNSLAGGIILKTKNPEFEANGALKVDYSTNNTSRLSVVQTGPITDKLAFRISAERSASDGFITNDEIKDDKFNKSESLNVRGKLLYQFDNGADAVLTLNKVKTDTDGSERASNGNADTTNVTSAFQRKSESEIDGYRITDIKSYSSDISKQLNSNWSFKSLTAYNNSVYDADYDADGLDGDSYGVAERDIKDTSQEFRFTYQKDKINALFGFFLANGEAINNSNNYNLLLNGASLNVDTDSSEDYTNMALFTNIDYKLTDKLTLISGLRIDRDERTSENSTTAKRVYDYSTNNDALIDYLVQANSVSETVAQSIITANGGTTAFGTIVNKGADDLIKSNTNQNLKNENSTVNLLPKLGINYKWNNHINTGILFSQGYRPGGISVDLTTANSGTYDAEFTDNLELSFRSKWLENTLTVNANVFYTKYKDMQVDQKNDRGDTLIVNAGKATMKGIELDTKYLVNDELDIFGSIGYIKAKFTDYDGYDGNEFPETPRITANIGSTYRHHSGYFIGANVTYTDDSFGDIDNTDDVKSYTLTNIKVGYEKEDWAAYIYSNNLFDKEYLLRNFDSNDTTSIGDPRIVGVTLTYSW